MKTKKNINLTIPDYLTVEQYVKMSDYKGDSELGRLIHKVSTISGYSEQEIRHWDLESLNKVVTLYNEIADPKASFHPVLEFNGQLYGYSNIKQMSLGEYIDLEEYSKDLASNMNKVAAILYRPITKQRFGTLKFAVKQKIKMLTNDVENVFDWYDIEKYDYESMLGQAEQFKQFPAHILLGAIGFFLANASQYLIHTAYLEKRINKREMTRLMIQMERSLIQSIGDGGVLSTTSPKLTYYQFQGKNESQI